MNQMGAEAKDDKYFSKQTSSRWLRYGGLTTTAIIALTASTALWTTQNQPLYKGKFQLLANQDSTDTITVDTQKQLLASQKVLQPLAKKIDVSNLSLERLPNTTVIEVSYRNAEPQKIMAALNELSKLYLSYGQTVNKVPVERSSTYVEKQVSQLREKVKQQQDKLEKLRQSQQSLTPQERSQYLNDQLAAVQNQLTETKIRLGEANTLVTSLTQQVQLTPPEAIAASGLNNANRYQGLLNKLQELDVDIAKQSAVFKEDSPVIQTLTEQRSKLSTLANEEARKLLGKEAGKVQNLPLEISPNPVKENLSKQLIETTNALQVLNQRETILEGHLKQIQEEIERMPRIAKEYEQLQQSLQLYTDSLARYQATQEKLKLEESKTVNFFTLISPPALNPEPTYPSLPYNLALAAVTGLIFGLASAAAIDVFNTNFYPEDLRNVIE